MKLINDFKFEENIKFFDEPILTKFVNGVLRKGNKIFAFKFLREVFFQLKFYCFKNNFSSIHGVFFKAITNIKPKVFLKSIVLVWFYFFGT